MFRRVVRVVGVFVAVVALTGPAIAEKDKSDKDDKVPGGKKFARLQMQILELQGQLGTLAAQHAAADQRLADLESSFAEAQAELAANTASISALLTADQELHNLIDGLQAHAAQIEERLASLETLPGEVEALSTELHGLRTRVEQLEAEVATKQAAITGICAPGSAIRQINSDGTVVCQPMPVAQLSDYFEQTSFVAVANGATSWTVSCVSGYDLLSGGFDLGFTSGLQVLYSGPSNESGFPQRWRVTVNAASSLTPPQRQLRLTLRCGKVIQ
jgi:uncharacterized protein YlxW (UPF0749 family)